MSTAWGRSRIRVRRAHNGTHRRTSPKHLRRRAAGAAERLSVKDMHALDGAAAVRNMVGRTPAHKQQMAGNAPCGV